MISVSKDKQVYTLLCDECQHNMCVSIGDGKTPEQTLVDNLVLNAMLRLWQFRFNKTLNRYMHYCETCFNLLHTEETEKHYEN